MSNIDLSIVVPVYNEIARLEAGLRGILGWMATAPMPAELVVVDDGSTDGTAARAAEILAGQPQARVLGMPVNRGKGAAVKAGMLAARGNVRLFTDVDLSVSIETAAEFHARCGQTADVVIGTRKVEASQVTVRQPRYREMLGEVFRQFTLRAFTPGLSDITCGFKAFTAAAAERVFGASVISRWSFDAEILFLAQRYGLRIQEVPVVWRNSAQSKVRLWLDLPRSLAELARIRWRWLRGGYGRP